MPDYPKLPYTWTVDGLKFNAGGSGGAIRYITFVTGHRGQTGRRSNKRPRTAAAGSYVGGVYREARVIVFDRCVSVVAGTDQEQAERDRLAALFGGEPDRLASLVHTQGGRSRIFRGVLDSPLEPEPLGPNGLMYGFTVFCPDPRVYSGNPDGSPVVSGPVSLDDRSVSYGGTQWDGTNGTGTQWDGPDGSGLVYDTPPAGLPGTPGVLTLVNAGDAPTSVLLRVQAVTDTPFPSIHHPDGSLLTFDGTLTAGSVWSVDTGDGRMWLNGAAAPGVLRNADMFELQPGTTTLRFASPSATADARLWATHYSAHYSG